MLELRPNCELCDRDLPPDAADARICSYECTYCVQCVEEVLHDVCPTCGGNFAPRPVRPRQAHRDAPRLGLGQQPATTQRHHCRWSPEEIAAMSAKLRGVAPSAR